MTISLGGKAFMGMGGFKKCPGNRLQRTEKYLVSRVRAPDCYRLVSYFKLLETGCKTSSDLSVKKYDVSYVFCKRSKQRQKSMHKVQGVRDTFGVVSAMQTI